MSGDQYDELLDALDDFREKRQSWGQEVSRAGFYDPQGYAEKRAKEGIAKAKERLDVVFKAIVRNCDPSIALAFGAKTIV